jgi:hypothetical protein
MPSDWIAARIRKEQTLCRVGFWAPRLPNWQFLPFDIRALFRLVPNKRFVDGSSKVGAWKKAV